MKETALSLGHSVLEANNVVGSPLVTLNFVNPDHRLTLPYPDGDWYLRNTAVPAVRENETVLCTTLVPGLQKYYREIGLIPEDAHVIEVEPQLDQSKALGYPYTDSLASIAGQVKIENGTAPIYIVPTYTNQATELQASQVGLRSIDRVDSVITNNKAGLRDAAEQYGIPMLSGKVIHTEKDMMDAAEQYGNLDHGVWLKFTTGSGGDLVYRVRTVTDSALREGMEKMRSSTARAFTQGKFNISAEGFWPANKFTPEGLPLVVESDARNEGEILMNGSNHFLTGKDGDVQILNQFEQILTDEGEYLGSRTFAPEGRTKELLRDVTLRVAEYNTKENKFYGIQGIDWFLMRDKAGELQVKVVELNSRPIVSSLPVIIADKMKAPHWINTNIYTDTPVQDINDYFKIVGEDLAHGEPSHGLVIPQSFRTLVTRREVIPSPNMKVLIMGDSPEICNNTVELLRQRGVRFTPGD